MVCTRDRRHAAAMTTISANQPIWFAPRTLARIAGVCYLLIVGAAFNEGYVVPKIVTSGDPAATAAHIRASSALFRAGFVGDMMAGVFWIFLAMCLYLLLRNVHQLLAGAMVMLAAVGGGIQIFNQLNQYTALTVATDNTYTHAFGTTGADGTALLFAGMQQNGYIIDAVFFGLWLIPLGLLVVRSGWFPKALGMLLVVGGCAYIGNMFAVILHWNLAATLLLIPAGLAELSFLLWLLVKGVPADSMPGMRDLTAGPTRHDVP